MGPQPEPTLAGQVTAMGAPNSAGAGRGVLNEQPGDRAAYAAGHPQRFSSGGGGQFTGSGASGSWGPSTPVTPDTNAAVATSLGTATAPAPSQASALPKAAQAAAQAGQTQPVAASDFNFDPTQLNAKVTFT